MQSEVYMSNEWIIDVLTDLKSVADKNGLHATASELKDVCLIALAEIAALEAGNAGLAIAHEGGAGKPGQQLAESDVA